MMYKTDKFAMSRPLPFYRHRTSIAALEKINFTFDSHEERLLLMHLLSFDEVAPKCSEYCYHISFAKIAVTAHSFEGQRKHELKRSGVEC